MEQGLPQIDPMIQKIVMGMLGERGINMGNLGITPEMLSGLAGQQGQGQLQTRGRVPAQRYGRV